MTDHRHDDMARMRDGGYTLEEIGDHFGISRQRVYQILGTTGIRADERDARTELEIAREVDDLYRRYRAGEPARLLIGDPPRRHIRKQVLEREIAHRATRYTDLGRLASRDTRRKVVLRDIQRWAASRGSPPTAGQWIAPDQATRLIHRRGGYPHYSTVVRLFGTWNKAIAAAGFDPRPRGGQQRA